MRFFLPSAMTGLRQSTPLTHVLVAADEAEVPYIEETCCLPAMWWPTAVPLAHVSGKQEPAIFPLAMFYGFPYGDRKRFLQDEAVTWVL
jgi:hypothetical protein